MMKSVQEKIVEFFSRVPNSRDSGSRSGGGGGTGKAIKFPMKVRKQQLHPSPAEEDGTCIAHRYSKPRPEC